MLGSATADCFLAVALVVALGDALGVVLVSVEVKVFVWGSWELRDGRTGSPDDLPVHFEVSEIYPSCCLADMNLDESVRRDLRNGIFHVEMATTVSLIIIVF